MTSFDEDGGDDVSSFDSSADVMIGLVAVVLLAVLMVIPLADFAHTRNLVQEQTVEALTHAGKLTVAGRDAHVFLAMPDRLVLPGSAGREDAIHVDDILDDAGLQARIAKLRRDNAVPVLIVTERGQESAFLVETVLNRLGVPALSRIFLDSSCGYLANDARPASCVQETVLASSDGS
ncbi:hypothetical protein [Roseibium sp.]|uniref:hypothetical protein n=1 Tax=Roseibium sp. TaxID=1936156 RepID=UPI003265AC33